MGILVRKTIFWNHTWRKIKAWFITFLSFFSISMNAASALNVDSTDDVTWLTLNRKDGNFSKLLNNLFLVYKSKKFENGLHQQKINKNLNNTEHNFDDDNNIFIDENLTPMMHFTADGWNVMDSFMDAAQQMGLL